MKALALSLIWYLGSSLLLSQYFGNHLVEIINNYTFSLFLSERQFVEETTAPFPLSPAGWLLSTLLRLQYFEDSWVIRMFTSVCLKNLYPAFPRLH